MTPVERITKKAGLVLYVDGLERGQRHTRDIVVRCEVDPGSGVEEHLTFTVPSHQAPHLGEQVRVRVEWGPVDEGIE